MDKRIGFRPSSWLLVVLLALSVLLGACSPEDNSTPTNPAATPVPATATSMEELLATTAAPATTGPVATGEPSATDVTSPEVFPETGATATGAEPIQPASPEAATVTSLPDPSAFTWRQVADGLSTPVGISNAGDGSGRLFILEKAGLIRILQAESLLPQPFLDIRDRVGSESSEQGLLGLAFHPQYTQNGFFYVNYTDRNGDTVIARFSVSSDPNLAEPASEMQLLFVDQPYANHNGGGVVFGPDGYLYLGLGDGGAGGDPQDNAISLETLLGKILRIDVDGGQPYAIPADNPFAQGAAAGGLPEIWAYGLRNPWRFAFDRQTGDVYIGDVGQNEWEEINFLPAGNKGGVHFGWDYFEGTHPFEDTPPADAVLEMPVAEYSHSEGGCSVTGGAVYRGAKLQDWQGVYLYGDFCSGRIWGLRPTPEGWQNDLLFEQAGQITSFGEDETGEIYLANITGQIYVLDGK